MNASRKSPGLCQETGTVINPQNNLDPMKIETTPTGCKPDNFRSSRSFKTRFKIAGDDKIYEVLGQEARTLNALIAAGSGGITSLEMSSWALRLAHYAMKLRRLGLDIETVREDHHHPVKGWHARYILKTSIQILGDQGRAAA